LTVPIVSTGKCESLLVCGPYLKAELTAADIRRQWAELRGGRARPFDTELVAYARAVLRTPVLDQAGSDAFREFVELIGRLFVEEQDQRALSLRIFEHGRKSFARLPRALLDKTAMFLDPVMSASWREGLQPWDKIELGLHDAPNLALAVFPSHGAASSDDTLELLVRANRFQIACVEFAKSLPETLCARLSETGVLFLLHINPTQSRTRRRLQLRDRADAIRSFVHRELATQAFMGAGSLVENVHQLHRSAEQAVYAMQLALHRELPLLFYEDEARAEGALGRSKQPLPAARAARQLLSLYEHGEILDAAHAEYVRHVVAESGGVASVMRVHFEHLLFGLLELVQRRAQLDAKVLGELEERIANSLSSALTTVELLTVFRQWFDTLLRVSSQPGTEQRELRLERAANFIRENCGRSLELAEVAKYAGFSRNYFSRLFRDAFGVGFARYLREQRLERARKLLRTSDLPVQRIAHDAGFQSVTQFCAAFKSAVGLTPQTYRARAPRAAAG
jgi:AraC-like DNA-binding protein